MIVWWQAALIGAGALPVWQYALPYQRPPLVEWRSPDFKATEPMYSKPRRRMSFDALVVPDLSSTMSSIVDLSAALISTLRSPVPSVNLNSQSRCGLQVRLAHSALTCFL